MTPNEEATIPASRAISPTPAPTPPPPNPLDLPPAHSNPFHPDPPPWYRPKTDESGEPRYQDTIIAGLLIPCEEGWRWWGKLNNTTYRGAHTEDGTVLGALHLAFIDHSYPFRIGLAQCRHDPWSDFLVITQSKRGWFLNTGPTGLEEVIQADLKDVLKPGEREKKACELIYQDLGRRIQSVDRIPWDLSLLISRDHYIRVQVFFRMSLLFVKW